MDFDFDRHLSAVERSVSSSEREGMPAHDVTLSRSCETTVGDLWDAVTNPERIPRWFLPVSGDLEQGGRYQLDGNAGGRITECEPLSHFALTWEFDDDISWMKVSISEDGGGRARITLTHTAYHLEHWNVYGPGATGVGWELGLVGLDIYLSNPHEPMPDETEFATSPEGRSFIAGSSDGWGRAAAASGTESATARAAADRTTAFYTGEAS